MKIVIVLSPIFLPSNTPRSEIFDEAEENIKECFEDLEINPEHIVFSTFEESYSVIRRENPSIAIFMPGNIIEQVYTNQAMEMLQRDPLTCRIRKHLHAIDQTPIYSARDLEIRGRLLGLPENKGITLPYFAERQTKTN